MVVVIKLYLPGGKGMMSLGLDKDYGEFGQCLFFKFVSECG